MKRFKRLFALTLAVFIFTVTPFSDYIKAREEAQAAAVVPALPALAGGAKFVFDLLLSVLGIHMAGEMLGGFVDALGDWVKVDGRYVAVFNRMIEDSSKWTYGEVVSISQDAISMLRDFLNTQKGYGTDTGIEKIQYGAVAPAFENSVTFKNNIDLVDLNSGLSASNYAFTIDTCVYANDVTSATGYDIYVNPDVVRFGGFVKESYTITGNGREYYDSINFNGINSNGVILQGFGMVRYWNEIVKFWKYTTTIYEMRLPQRITDNSLDYISYPIYGSLEELRNYLSTGEIGQPVNSYSDYTFEANVESAPDIQGRELETDGTIAIPGTETEVLELLTSIKEAVTAKEREKALAPTLTVIYGGKSNQEEPEEPNKNFPWVPDITGPIKKLCKSLDDVKAFVKNIPGSLSDILKAIKAMPGQMVDSVANLFNSNDDDLDPNKWKLSSDIVNKFPFCIPFDLFACIQLFSETSIKPRWEFPFNVDSLGIRESIVIDLSTDDWQPLVMVIRITTLVSYCIGLIVLTRGLIKG